MNKQELTKTFSKYGDFVSVNDVADCMRIDRGTARQFLFGLDFIPCGRKKLYHISDIAQRLIEILRSRGRVRVDCK